MGRQRGEQEQERLDRGAGRAVVAEALGEVVVQLGQLGDHRVEAQRLHALARRGDGPVHHALRVVVGVVLGDAQLPGVLVDHVAPDALQQPVDPDHVTRCSTVGSGRRAR